MRRSFLKNTIPPKYLKKTNTVITQFIKRYGCRHIRYIPFFFHFFPFNIFCDLQSAEQIIKRYLYHLLYFVFFNFQPIKISIFLHKYIILYNRAHIIAL